MLEKLFIPNPDAQQPNPIRPRKGVIIGLGQVGLACAYSMIIQNCFEELILQDIAQEKLEGEVMDLVHGMVLVGIGGNILTPQVGITLGFLFKPLINLLG